MATKEYYKSSFVDGISLDDHFNNVNLNQNNHKLLSVDGRRSTDLTASDKTKYPNYDFIEYNNSKAKKDSILWNYSDTKKLPPSNISIHRFSDKEKDENDSKSANKSTLSLHIDAYENLNEASEEFSEEFSKMKCKKIGLFKEWKTANESFSVSPSFIRHSFEFPRQQENILNMQPEIMHFKASQILLNPNLSETELLYWIFENSKFIYSLIGLIIGTIYALTSCGSKLPRRNLDPEAQKVRRKIYGRASEGVQQQKVVEKSQSQPSDFVNSDEEEFESVQGMPLEVVLKKGENKSEKNSSSSRRRKVSKHEKVREELNVDRTQESDEEPPRNNNKCKPKPFKMDEIPEEPQQLHGGTLKKKKSSNRHHRNREGGPKQSREYRRRRPKHRQDDEDDTLYEIGREMPTVDFSQEFYETRKKSVATAATTNSKEQSLK